jgi:8-oxo-dGTP pyrophosphatase MutT (NUDIX family)
MNHDKELWQEFAPNGASANLGFSKPEFFNRAKICASAHVWLWRRAENAPPQVEVLLQLRSPNKTNWPGDGDISSAGHIDVNETVLDAAERETLEEIGLAIERDKLYYIFSDHHFGRLYEELRHVFLYEYNGKDNFTFSDGEVEQLKWVSLDHLKQWDKDAAATEPVVPHGETYWSQLFWHLERLATRENP